MSVFVSLILLAVGLFILVKGADFLVSGASSLAQKFKVSPIVIGLTIVAFGTSTPELVVSLASAISGKTDIALGNIIGSNIANILLILGASAVVYPLTVHKNTVWKEIPMSFLGGIMITVLALQNLIDSNELLHTLKPSQDVIGSITRSNGIVLLSFFVIFLYYTFGIARVSSTDEPEIEKRKMSASVILIALGLLGLTFGSKFFVDGSVKVASFLGVSDTLIGLTLVAIGTSFPELVTSVVAAYRKKVDIAVGNVVGSNIFNIFFVLGATSIVRELPLRLAVLTDILVLFGATILLFVSLFIRKRHTISRLEGSLMLGAYLLYLVFLVIRG